MSEIPYEERRRRAWPWVVGLSLLVLLIWSMALRPGRGGDVEVRDGANRLGAVEAPAQPAPTAAEGEGKEREARDKTKDEDLERERMLRMRTRMIA